MSQVQQLKQALVKKAKSLTLRQLIEVFEHTNTVNGPEIPVLRGELMDVLEARDSQAFEAWLDSRADSPRDFFLAAA